MIVLERDTTGDMLDEFLEWLEAQRAGELAGVPRRGDEEYV